MMYNLHDFLGVKVYFYLIFWKRIFFLLNCVKNEKKNGENKLTEILAVEDNNIEI